MVRRASISVAVAAALASADASADVTQPAPGLTLIRSAPHAMVVVDLCAPGVGVRATRYDERKKTAPEWGASLGLAAAVNGDFFDFPGWTLVNGRARGAGEDWPKQFYEARQAWEFGPSRAGLQVDANVPPDAPPAVTDVVGGHNLIIADGQSRGPGFDGDAVLAGGHRRTAIGISQSRRTLFLFASDALLTGTGLADAVLALAAQAPGAPPVWQATNQDGGGSSQLWVAGVGAVISSTRQVANHLGVFATGVGPATSCNDRAPGGALDAAGCDVVDGWAQDADTPASPIEVHLYFGGPAGAPGAIGSAVHADVSRADLCQAIGSCEHGFSRLSPLSLHDGQPHPVHAYGIDADGALNAELGGSPRSLTCPPTLPAGVRRWVTNPSSYAAWKLDAFEQRLPVSDAAIDALAEGPSWPAAPSLVRAAPAPEVWLVDGAARRHVPSPAVAAAWRLDLGAVQIVPQSGVDALVKGPPLRARPVMVERATGQVYLLDDAFGAVGQGGAAGSGAAGAAGKAGAGGPQPQPGAGGSGAASGGAAGGAGLPGATSHAGAAGRVAAPLTSGGESESGACSCGAPSGPGGVWLAALSVGVAWARRRVARRST